MSTARLWSIAGVAVAAGLVAGNGLGPLSNDPHETYLDCLTGSYEVSQLSGGQMIMEAYAKCRTAETGYAAYLNGQDIAGPRLLEVVARVNEAAFARYRGLELHETRGCFDRARAGLPVS